MSRRSPNLEAARREEIACSVEAITSYRFETRLTGLAGPVRERVNLGIADGGERSVFRTQSEKGGCEARVIGTAVYRSLRPDEFERTGKRWLRLDSQCDGLGDDWRTVMAHLIRMADNVPGVVQRFDTARCRVNQFAALSASPDGTAAAALAKYRDEHAVEDMTLTVFTSAAGRPMRLRLSIGEFTNCMEPEIRLRSTKDLYDFGVPVPTIIAPSEDQVYRLPATQAP